MPDRRFRPVLWGASVLLAIALGFWALWPEATDSQPQALPVRSLLSRAAPDFAPVDAGADYAFPADWRVHPETRAGSWRFQGHLHDREGRQFGFQLQWTRLALTAAPVPRPSAWGTRDVFRAQFALTEADTGRFMSAERYSRAALNLAGATAAMPAQVWLEDWRLAVLPDPAGHGRFQLRAAQAGGRLDLLLESSKPAVVASRYSLYQSGGRFRLVLLSRLRVQGNLTIQGRTLAVSGEAWAERVTGELPLPAGRLVWNRFILQLNDASELVCLQLRRRHETTMPIPSCLWLGPEGRIWELGRNAVTITPEARWRSKTDGLAYPAAWRLELPDRQRVLVLKPVLADQEIQGSIRYWSGLLEVYDGTGPESLAGHGYAELFPD